MRWCWRRSEGFESKDEFIYDIHILSIYHPPIYISRYPIFHEPPKPPPSLTARHPQLHKTRIELPQRTLEHPKIAPLPAPAPRTRPRRPHRVASAQPARYQPIAYTALMDTNNFHNKCGVGEREARIFSELVRKRNSYFGHGIGKGF